MNVIKYFRINWSVHSYAYWLLGIHVVFTVLINYYNPIFVDIINRKQWI